MAVVNIFYLSVEKLKVIDIFLTDNCIRHGADFL